MTMSNQAVLMYQSDDYVFFSTSGWQSKDRHHSISSLPGFPELHE